MSVSQVSQTPNVCLSCKILSASKMENIKCYFCDFLFHKAGTMWMHVVEQFWFNQCPIKQEWVKFKHQSNITSPPSVFKSPQNSLQQQGGLRMWYISICCTKLLWGVSVTFNTLESIIYIWHAASPTWIIQIVLTLLYFFQMDFHSNMKAFRWASSEMLSTEQTNKDVWESRTNTLTLI